MKVPLSWLAEFVEISEEAEQIAARLTAGGMKVEKIERPGRGLEGIVVAEVTGIKPHPDAEKLSLVQVRTGCLDVQVVCGASNFAAGDRVPLAQPGSRLPKAGEIKRRSIRGVSSEGMLCSAAELGLGDDHSGIMVLDPRAVVGSDLRDALGPDEVVLELEINPNRPDAMGLIGVAREVSACTGARLRDFGHLLAFESGTRQVAQLVDVQVRDPAGCPRYMARVIEGVSCSPSPFWARQRLIMCGVRPISAVVDATNYALLVTGHPLHAFDMDRVAGSEIVVRRASPGERMVTIDGVQRILDPDDLVIADRSRPVALAGVMGGRDSEVTGSTTRVILEAAAFQPASVFRTARRHLLRSEASARFERGVDPSGVAMASELAVALILQWAGGEAAAGVVDVYPGPVGRRLLTMRPERANRLLGTDLPAEAMTGALERLGLSPVARDKVIEVTVPTFRMDLNLEEDLVEEVARVSGYDKIPATLPAGSNRAGRLPEPEKLIRRLKRVLNGAGLHEARTSSLVGPADLEGVGLDPAAAVRVANPLTKDESLLRTSLLPGLLRSAALNFSRRPGDVRLFESGITFRAGDNRDPAEHLSLGMVVGGVRPQQWHSPARQLDFFDLKGVVEVVLRSLHIGDVTFQPGGGRPFHPARTAVMFAPGGRRLGILGELDVAAAGRLGIPVRMSAGELDLQALVELAEPPGSAQAAPVTGRFPAVLLDLAVSVPEEVPAAGVLATAQQAGGELLESVRLIDVYRGDQVGQGRKSLALSLTFRSPDRTLNEQEAIAGRDAIASALEGRYGGKVRA